VSDHNERACPDCGKPMAEVHTCSPQVAWMKRRVDQAERECQEQARLNGMGSEREARLRAQVEQLQRELAEAEQREQAAREDTRIGQAINRACAELPEGYVIQIDLEHGAGTVILCPPDTDATIDDFDGDGFVDYLNSAIDAARQK